MEQGYTGAHRQVTPADLLHGDKAPHVLIFEIGLSGHHAPYLERIASHYLGCGCSVTLTVAAQQLHLLQLSSLRKEKPDRLNIIAITDPLMRSQSRFGQAPRSEALRELRVWQAMRTVHRRVAQKAQIDLVFLPYADYALYAIGLLGSPFGVTRWSGICMRPAFHQRDMGLKGPPPSMLGTIKGKLLFRLLAQPYLDRLLTLDPILPQWVALRDASVARKLQNFPDPCEIGAVPTQQEARRELRLPERIPVLLVFGTLDDRKCIRQLVSALAERDPIWCLLLVGRQSPTLREFLSSGVATQLRRKGQLFEVDDYVKSEVESAAFAACDAVWVGYRDHYNSSGVLLRGALQGKPVIGADIGLIGYQIQQHQLGLVIDPAVPETIVKALTLLAEPSFRCDITRKLANCFPTHNWQYCSRLLPLAR